VAPSRFAPASPEAFADVARLTLPSRRELLRIRWRADDGQISVSGGGAVRVAPPDSLRVDLAAQLGLGRAVVVMAGESAWAQPEVIVNRLLPERFVLWAVIGVVRAPAGELRVERVGHDEREVWRVWDARGVATAFELRQGALVGATREAEGRMVARLALTLDVNGSVVRARLEYESGARMEIEVLERHAAEAFPEAIWRVGG
jgi:hypothetical protein